jgi:hypothetical protein
VQVKYLLSPENKKPAESSAGFLFCKQLSANVHQVHVNDRGHQQTQVLHQLDAHKQLLQL